MNNIAIIPARSGSKGLKDKNIRLLNGKPLISYSIEAANKSGLFNIVMVSTDSQEYADISMKYGAQVPFLRSEATSSDIAGSWDVVEEVMNRYLNLDKRFDTVCLLQPTSPLRTSEDIVSAYKILNGTEADAITSVCECEHNPQYSMTLDSDLSLDQFREHTDSLPRQQLPKYYRLNGAIYIRKLEYSNNIVTIRSSKEHALIMSQDHSIDIDTIFDFEYAEFLLSKEKRI